MFPEFDPDKFPAPITRASAVQITVSDQESVDDVTMTEHVMDDEAITRRSWFTWTAAISVLGTWVAEGFQLDHGRLMEMLRNRLGFAPEGELHVQVLTAPPLAMIQAIQGEETPAALKADEQLSELAMVECRAAAKREAGEAVYIARNAAEFFADRSLPVTVDVLVELYDPLGIFRDSRNYNHRARIVERAVADGFEFFYEDSARADAALMIHRWGNGVFAALRETAP